MPQIHPSDDVDTIVQWKQVKRKRYKPKKLWCNCCTRTQESVVKVLLFALIGCPTTLLIFSALFGLILMMFETSLDFFNAFLYMGALFTAACNPLTNWQPVTAFGNAMSLVIASWAVLVFGIVLAVCSGPVMEPLLERLKLNKEIQFSTWGFCRKTCLFIKISLVAMVGVPFLLSIASVLFSGPLALAEGWGFGASFLYIASELAAMTNPATQVMPVTPVGMILSLYISAQATCTFCVLLAFLGAPMVLSVYTEISSMHNSAEDEEEIEEIEYEPMPDDKNDKLYNMTGSAIAGANHPPSPSSPKEFDRLNNASASFVELGIVKEKKKKSKSHRHKRDCPNHPGNKSKKGKRYSL